MCRSTYPLKLPASIKTAAQRLAKKDGVSLNQWIFVTIAKKIGVVETADSFFEERAKESNGQALNHFLVHAPDRIPDPGDELL